MAPPIYHLYGLCPDADRPTVEAYWSPSLPKTGNRPGAREARTVTTSEPRNGAQRRTGSHAWAWS